MTSGSNHPEGSFDFIKRASRRLDAITRDYAVAKPMQWGVLVIVMAVMIGFFSRFPAYTGADVPFPGSLAQFHKTQYGQAIDWWLTHPFQRVPTEEIFGPGADRNAWIKGAISHCDKLTFRAFIPTLGILTNGGFFTLMAANHLASFVTFILVYIICLRSTKNTLVSALATWAYAASWAGSWGFNDFLYGDAVAMALLLVPLVTTRFMLVAACVFFAAFTDERAICTAPLIILFRYWQLNPPFGETNARPNLHQLGQTSLPVIAGVLAYAVVRLCISQRLGLVAGTSMMASPQIPIHHFYINYPATLFKVFEFLWLALILMILNLAFSAKPRRGRLMVYVICMFFAASPALLVWDFDRSIFYLMPAVIASICFTPGALEERTQMMLGLFAASFFWLNPLESWLRYLLN
jgi:hypothetical protein